MLRRLYTFLFYLLLPWFVVRLFLRSRKQKAYRDYLAERFGFYRFRLQQSIWVHAVSMGESIAAFPLIQALKQRYPDRPIVVTNMTPTGRARVQAVLKETVLVCYLPYDLPYFMRRFFNAMNPAMGIIMETELWPNMIHAAKKKTIPLYLLNARLSEQSFLGYTKIRSLMRPLLQSFRAIAVGSDEEMQRLIALGAKRETLSVTGNIKFDVTIPETTLAASRSLRETWRATFVWIAASTHPGEEEIILAAHKKLLAVDKQALLILVPRHPERFSAVYDLCQKNFSVVRRSDAGSTASSFQIYLGDTMGELLMLYAASDLAFVGGSLIPHGGHNLIEPALLQKPLLAGPHVFNFKDVSNRLQQQNALQYVTDADTLFAALNALRQNENQRQILGKKALTVANANRGALQRQLDLLATAVNL